MAKTNLKPKKQDDFSANGDKHMSFCDAAQVVLQKAAKPLSYREIVKKALQDDLIQSSSKTPDVSMYISLRSEISRREQRNEPQRLVFLGNGLFTLVELITGAPTKKTQTAIEQVRQSRQEACDDLYKKLTSKNQGDNFETMVADLLIALGYQNVEVIGGRDDQGVDILCEKRDGVTKIKVAIQCKCKDLKNRIGPKDVSTLRDNLSTYQSQQGILITTTELNDDAKAKAKEAGKDPIHFIEHAEILDLFAEYNIGLRSEPVKYFQVDKSKYEFLK
mgnify:CR=1 FL=1